MIAVKHQRERFPSLHQARVIAHRFLLFISRPKKNRNMERTASVIRSPDNASHNVVYHKAYKGPLPSSIFFQDCATASKSIKDPNITDIEELQNSEKFQINTIDDPLDTKVNFLKVHLKNQKDLPALKNVALKTTTKSLHSSSKTLSNCNDALYCVIDQKLPDETQNAKSKFHSTRDITASQKVKDKCSTTQLGLHDLCTPRFSRRIRVTAGGQVVLHRSCL